MGKRIIIFVGLICLTGLMAFTAGCSSENDAPHRPQVVNKKIVLDKKAPPAPIVAKPGGGPKVTATKSAGQIPVPAPPPAVKPQTEPGPGLLSSLFQKMGGTPASDAYNPTGKVDPFLPLFRAEPAQIKEKRKQKQAGPLTPLQKVDLSQLKLVAIIRGAHEPVAMVEEASGKGYIVRKGTYIGIHSGRVVTILADALKIEEEVEDVMGNVTLRVRELKLHKRGGEE